MFAVPMINVRECWRSVVHGIVGKLNFIIEYDRNRFVVDFVDEIFTNNDENETTGTEILLCTGENHAELNRREIIFQSRVFFFSLYFSNVELTSEKIR